MCRTRKSVFYTLNVFVLWPTLLARQQELPKQTEVQSPESMDCLFWFTRGVMVWTKAAWRWSESSHGGEYQENKTWVGAAPQGKKIFSLLEYWWAYEPTWMGAGEEMSRQGNSMTCTCAASAASLHKVDKDFMLGNQNELVLEKTNNPQKLFS